MKYVVYAEKSLFNIEPLFEMECDSLKYDRKDYLESFLQDENVIGMLYQDNLTPEESDGIGFYDADDYIEKIPHIICERLNLSSIYVEYMWRQVLMEKCYIKKIWIYFVF